MMTIVIKKFQQKKKSFCDLKREMIEEKKKRIRWGVWRKDVVELAVLLEEVIERMNTSALNPLTKFLSPSRTTLCNFYYCYEMK